MPRPRFGIAVWDESMLARVRSGDVDFVVLTHTLLEMPRAGAARGLAERIRARLGNVDLIGHAWHLVTYQRGDALPGRGKRTVVGDPSAVGHFADTPEVEEAWAATLRMAEAFSSAHIVLRTPPSFTPGARSLGRLRSFVARHGADGYRLIWQPEGLWEPEHLVEAARELELDLLTAAQGPWAEAADWVGIGAAGPAPRLAAADAEAIVEGLLQGPTDVPAPLLFGGPEALSNLRRVRRAWSDLA